MMAWPLPALFLLLLAGCDWDVLEKEEEDEPPRVNGTDLLTYDNGHPLKTSSSDGLVLMIEDHLAELTNDHRVAMGLDALLPDPDARECARAHARHMAGHPFFDHVNPEGDDPGVRLSVCGVEWRTYGENLAAGQESADAAFAGLLDSPPHRENLEDPGWTHEGHGFWTGGPHGTYYAQSFVRR